MAPRTCTKELYEGIGHNGTTGFFNFRYHLFKQWSVQSYLNYDFEFDNLNYSIFLERSAGRVLLRASYRSLSKQFQLEILKR